MADVTPGEWIAALVPVILDHADELTELDRCIGDADHGVNMARGAAAVLAKVDSLGQGSLAAMVRGRGSPWS